MRLKICMDEVCSIFNFMVITIPIIIIDRLNTKFKKNFTGIISKDAQYQSLIGVRKDCLVYVHLYFQQVIVFYMCFREISRYPTIIISSHLSVNVCKYDCTVTYIFLNRKIPYSTILSAHTSILVETSNFPYIK